MNWFAIIGMVAEVAKEAPHLIDDVRDIVNRLRSHEPPSAEVVKTLNDVMGSTTKS